MFEIGCVFSCILLCHAVDLSVSANVDDEILLTDEMSRRINELRKYFLNRTIRGFVTCILSYFGPLGGIFAHKL